MGQRKRELIRRKASGEKPERLSRHVPGPIQKLVEEMDTEELEAAIHRISEARKFGSRLLSTFALANAQTREWANAHYSKMAEMV